MVTCWPALLMLQTFFSPIFTEMVGKLSKEDEAQFEELKVQNSELNKYAYSPLSILTIVIAASPAQAQMVDPYT